MIDFRDHDQREHAATLEQRLSRPKSDLQLAHYVRKKMRDQGMRVPLTEAEQFAAAEKRMRAGR